MRVYFYKLKKQIKVTLNIINDCKLKYNKKKL